MLIRIANFCQDREGIRPSGTCSGTGRPFSRRVRALCVWSRIRRHRLSMAKTTGQI